MNRFVLLGAISLIALTSLSGNTSSVVTTPSIQTALSLPSDAILLERAGLIDRLTHVFQKGSDITTVALVGAVNMGGLGKTTLARLWATKRLAATPTLTVWELNAETEATLLQSLKELSVQLAVTADQKTALKTIDNIQNASDRESKRLAFVQGILKDAKDWVLIYDNVENLSDIEAYLPKDVGVWGKGQVIVTSRNTQLPTTIGTVVTLDNLTPDESLTLYSRIRYQKDPKSLTAAETKDAKELLAKLPPYPLDISIGAAYIAIHKLTPKDYLLALDKQPVSDLKDDAKVRYQIITLSVQKVMDSAKENIERMLILALMDSQNIPADILKKTTDAKGFTQAFTNDMMKHSLITMGTASGDIGTISMHRSTWEIMYAYLVKTQTLSTTHPLVRNVAQEIFKYVNTTIDDDKCNVLRLLELHGRRIYESVLFTDDEKMEAIGMLGCISYYAIKGKESQELLERSIKYFEHTKTGGKDLLARLYMHLGMVHRLNCNYPWAEEYLSKSLQEYTVSKNTVGCIDSICLLAHTYYVMGNFLKAKEQLEKTKTFNSTDTSTKGLILRIACLIERDLGDMHLALKYINEAVLHRESMNKVDQLQAWNIMYKGLVYRDMGDYVAANLWGDKGDVLYSQFDTTTKMYACVKFYRSSIYRMLGNYVEAEKWLNIALSICEREAAENPLELGFGKTQLAKIYRNTGYLDKAFIEAKAAEKLYVDLFGERNLRTSWIRMTLGQIYNDQGTYTQAKDIFQESLDVHRTMLNDSHPKIGKILSELGYAQVKIGDIKEGHSNLELGLKNYEAHYGKDHLRVAYVLRLISESLQIQGDLKGAEAAAMRADTICQKANHPDQIVSLERLGDVRIKAGNSQGSSDLKKALTMAETTFGAGSPHVTRLKAKL